MPRKPAPTMLECGHFATGERDGKPWCSMCADKAAAEACAQLEKDVVARASAMPDPTVAPATPPASGAGATGVIEPMVPGVYQMDDTRYHADPLRLHGTESLSATRSKLLLPPSTPAHYRWAVDHPQGHSPAFDMGHAVHRLVLGSGPDIEVVQVEVADRARKSIKIADSWEYKAAQQARENAYTAGLVPLLPAEYAQAQNMAHAVLAHPLGKLCFTNGQPEQAMFVQDAETGAWLRGKVDYLAQARDGRLVLVDLKTAGGDNAASPFKFPRAVVAYRYHRQAAWYSHLAKTLGLARDVTLVFAVVEKTPPYLVAFHEIDASDLRRAHALNRAAIDTFARCLAANHWPGYPATINRLALPSWAAYEEEAVLEGLPDE